MNDGLENLFITFQWDLRLGGSSRAMKTRIKMSWQTKDTIYKTKTKEELHTNDLLCIRQTSYCEIQTEIHDETEVILFIYMTSGRS